MEQNSEELSTPVSGEAATKPAARRTSRRVTAPAGEAAVTVAAEEAAPVKTTRATAAAKRAAASDAAATGTATEAAPTKAKASRAAAKGEKTEKPAKASAAEQAPVAEKPARATTARRSRAAAAAESSETTEAALTASNDAVSAAESVESAPTEAKKRPARGRKKASDTAAEEVPATASSETAVAEAAPGDDDAAEAPANGRRNSRNRSRKPAAETSESEAPAGEGENDENKNTDNRGGDNRNGQQSRGDNQQRSSRTRQRERKRRQSDDLDPELTEDDVLLPVAGILDVLDNYAFVRTSGYLPGTNDVYISLGQVKKYGLRKGDAVVGAIRQPRESDAGGRQKYNAIVKIDSINSNPATENQERPEFSELAPLFPQERFALDASGASAATRVIDAVAPIGKGQRALISGPARSGKSTLAGEIAATIGAQHPDAHLMVVLIDERPEEVTRQQRSVGGEVIASTFDRGVEDHATIADLAIERAKRLAELGHDVVLVIDSITSLVRAYNLLTPAATRGPAGVIDATAILPVKRLLGAARNIENGGSLTVIATVQTGTAIDDIILDELNGTANLEIRLDRTLAAKQLYPAVDVASTSTRNVDLLIGAAAAQATQQLRRRLVAQEPELALEDLLQQVASTASNAELLANAQRARA